MTELTCETIRESDAAARYVSNNLDGVEAERFESHLLVCAQCQEDLRLFAAITGEFKTGNSGRGPGRAIWLTALAAAATISLVVWNTWPIRQAEATFALGRVDAAPIYLGIPVRAGTERRDSLFVQAMAAYTVEDFETAADLLQSAVLAGDSSAPATFFLGSSLMMLDQNQTAAEAFQLAIRSGGSGYLPEAEFYLGKLNLRLGAVDEALGYLNDLGMTSVADQAAALADSVRELQR